MNMQEIKNRLMAQIGKSDPKAGQTVDQILGELDKATSEEVRRVLNEIPIHDDMFMGEIRHTNPSPEEIKFGPTQEASGAGAGKMIREYSNVAPQFGIVNLYNDFSRKLDSLKKSILMISEAVKAQNAVIQHVAKSQTPSVSDKSAPVFSDEVTKAKELIKKSKSLILKSELYGIDDLSFEDVMEDIRKADLLLKKAKSLLIKAEEEDEKEEEEEKEVEKSLGDVKKFSMRLGKAKEEIEGKKKEEEEKESKARKAEEDKKEEKEDKESKAHKSESESEKEKEEDKEKKAHKAKDNDKGNQNDKANKDGNQVDAAAKSSSEEILVMKKTIAEMMDIISNSSKYGKDVPNLSKAQADNYIVSKSADIESAFEAGLLSGGEEITARSILSMFELAQKGDIDPSVVTNRINSSSSAVKTVFNGN